MANKIKVNTAVVSGFVARDAFVNEAKTFLSFSVGYDKSYKNQKGEWINQTAWIPVKLWAKEDRILRLIEKVKKGSSVIVTGFMDQSSYPDKNGNTINDVFLRADSIQVYDEGGNIGTPANNNSNGGYNASYDAMPGYEPIPDEGNLNFGFLDGKQY